MEREKAPKDSETCNCKVNPVSLQNFPAQIVSGFGMGCMGWGGGVFSQITKQAPFTKANHWLPVTNEINKIVWFLDAR